MQYQTIAYEVEQRIATVTLNRPDRLNAWTPAMEAEVRDAMRKACDDKAVRVIVLTGAGRGFCAGVDMDRLSSMSQAEGPRPELLRPFDPTARPDFQKRLSYLPALPKPVLAAINGPCAGIGLALALYCDLRFAAAEARFSTAFARRGLIAEFGLAWLLPRVTSTSSAMDLLLSARKFEGEEALRLGVVDRVSPLSELIPAVRTYALDLAENVSPRSMSIIKRQVWESRLQSLADAVDVADQETLLSLDSDDFREGVSHFVDKRPANFQDL
jgi:enoyl-CoA hydratase/carnithine racemase